MLYILYIIILLLYNIRIQCTNYRCVILCNFHTAHIFTIIIIPILTVCSHLNCLDGDDFNTSTSGEILFPPSSTQGDIQCFSINILNDILYEVPENFIIELDTNDPAVTIPEHSDIAIITINDVPDPRGM